MNIFSRFFELVRKWFRPNRALPWPTNLEDSSLEESIVDSNNCDNSISTNSNNLEKKDVFITELKIKKQEENAELLDLQSKFESNQLPLKDLTDEQLDNLNDLYRRQIEDLKADLYRTKSEININMNKLEELSLKEA